MTYILDSDSLHTIKQALKRRFPRATQFASGLLRERLTDAEMTERFQRIYKGNYWSGTESVSGLGSSMEQTAVLRRVLPSLLKDLGVSTLLDAPCGDFHWMKELPLDVDYIGVDIVPEAIAQNHATYAGPRRTFLVRNITRDELPRADAIHCRDCLDHLSFEDALSALRNFQRSGATYLLATTYVDRTSNDDIPTSHWRPTNLQAAPFCFPPPLQLINEQCTEEDGKWADKSMGVWKLQELPLSRSRPRWS
jgi:hypothetical protein